MRWYRFRSKMDPEGSKTPRKTPGKKKAAMPVSEPGSPTPAAKKRKREDIKIEAEEEGAV
jgi:hypothetical protein